MRIGIDMGHCTSGFDTSARGIRVESDCDREIGKYVIAKLQTLGHEVINCTVDHADSMNGSLAARVSKANANNVDLYVSIHLNCFNGQAYGTETHIYGTGGKAEEYAKKVNTEMVALGFFNRGVKVSNFYVLRNTKAPAILVETCFCDSKTDMDLYAKLGPERIAAAIVKGITGQEVKPPAPTQPKEDGTYYRVITGSFKERSLAEAQVTELKQKGYDAFLITYKP